MVWREGQIGPLSHETLALCGANVFLMKPQAGFAGLLSDLEQEQALRFRRGEDRLAYETAHALKRLVISRELGIEPMDLDFFRDDRGKPRLRGRDLHFNLSHCDGAAAMALSTSAEVGIDVEWVSPYQFDQLLESIVFDPRELSQLADLAPPARSQALLSLWTLREAFAKATGDGLRDDPRVFWFDLNALRVHHAVARWRSAEEWRFHLCQPRPNLSLAVALGPCCSRRA